MRFEVTGLIDAALKLPADPGLCGLVRRFPAARLLGIRNVILDRYVSERLDRVSPEAPIPVLRQQQRFNRLGHAADAAFNITTLGGQAALISVTDSAMVGAQMHGRMHESLGIRVYFAQALEERGRPRGSSGGRGGT